MNKEELINFLKWNLTIEVITKAEYDNTLVTVTLYLEDKEISSSTDLIEG